MTPTREHIPALDGLRAIAALLVLAHHSPFDAWLPQEPFNQGMLGVDLFFVLSGFLITRILLYNRKQGIGLTAFYVRRAARIFPVAYIVLAFVWLVWQDTTSAGWAATYMFNWSRAFHPIESPIGHYWSLAVEEQFYMIFPLLLLAIPTRWVLRFAFAGLAAFIACNVAVVLAGAEGVISGHVASRVLFGGTVTRGTPLIVGILIAVSEQWIRADLRRPIYLAVLALMIYPLYQSICTNLASPLHAHMWGVYGQYVASASIASAIFLVSLAVSGCRVHALLSNRPLRYIGRISYGLYVYHLPIFWLTSIRGPFVDDWTFTRIVVALAVTFAVAALSHHLIEMPIMRFARKHENVVQQWVHTVFRRRSADTPPALAAD